MACAEKEFSSGISALQVENATSLPIVTQTDDLDSAPYVINFDNEKFAALLRDEHNFPDDKISELKVRLGRTSGISTALAHFNVKRNELLINGDTFWDKIYQRNVQEAESVISGEKRPSKSSFRYLSTKRLGEYLTSAPKDRAYELSKKLLLRSMNNEASSTMLHESKHVVEPGWYIKINYAEKFLKLTAFPVGYTALYVSTVDGILEKAAISIAGAIAGIAFDEAFVLSGMYHKFDSIEYRARNFEKENRSNQDWKGILTFSPREEE